MQLQTDNYPTETAWTLTRVCGTDNALELSKDNYEQANTDYTTDECVADRKYVFEITVSFFFDYSLPAFSLFLNTY